MAMQDRRGLTCLHHACWSDDLDAVALVLEEGCDPDASDSNGESPIFKTRDPAIIDLLVRYGAHIDHKSSLTGRTALLDAAVGGDSAVISKLVNLGADIYALDHYGNNAVTVAIKANREEALSVLLSLVKQEEVGIRKPSRWVACAKSEDSAVSLLQIPVYGRSTLLTLMHCTIPLCKPTSRSWVYLRAPRGSSLVWTLQQRIVTETRQWTASTSAASTLS